MSGGQYDVVVDVDEEASRKELAVPGYASNGTLLTAQENRATWAIQTYKRTLSSTHRVRIILSEHPDYLLKRRIDFEDGPNNRNKIPSDSSRESQKLGPA